MVMEIKLLVLLLLLQLPQWKTTIYCTKWCKVGFVTCIDRDPTRIGFRTDTVCVIHERLTFFCAFWVRLYVCG